MTNKPETEMVERAYKAAVASLEESCLLTDAYIGYGADSGDLMLEGYFDIHALVRAVIEALIEEPASAWLLKRAEDVSRSLNPLRSEDHIKSVALDSLTIHRSILRAALSPKQEEGR